jgi:hypothetical protein
MNLKNLMAVKSAICLVFGAMFMVIPVQSLEIYGLPVDSATIFMGRALGASFLLLMLLLWFARTDHGSVALWAIVLGVFVGDLIGFGVALWAVLTGITNAWGWLTVIIYGLLTLGFGYCLFRAPEVSPRPAA